MTDLHPDLDAWFGGAETTGRCIEHGTVLHGAETCPDCSPVEQQSETESPDPLERVPVHPDQMPLLFDQREE